MSLDLHVADLTALRRAVERLDRAETASPFTIEVDACTTTPALTPHPSWPRLSRLAVTTKGDGALLEAEFADEAHVRAVVAAVARSVAPGALDWPGWPDTAVGVSEVDGSADFPPDLVVADLEPTVQDLPDPHPVACRSSSWTGLHGQTVR